MPPSDRRASTSARGRRLARPARVLFLLAIAALAASCRQLEYYEKESFTRWTMQLSERASEQHFHQKVYYSVEGSAGGIGTKAGGGCGCY